MKKVINTEKLPIKLWLEDLDENTLEQAKNLANLPFAYKHIAIMPDSHKGYGMPIGSILATNNVVVPNAVGVDIGCGMIAQKTNITHIQTDDLKKILGIARKLIPVGMNSHNKAQDENLLPKGFENLTIAKNQITNAKKQLGTLGGGNHFIEIQKGSDGFIWIMIHSGSRNLGYKVAKHYNNLAIRLNELWFSKVETSKELAFLPIETDEAKQYLAEMNYCIDFALANRKLMMNKILEAMNEILGNFQLDLLINKSHNFAAWENHFNKNVIVHRKGATRAFKGEYGMIPGSQGTKSYIVIGKGNSDSFKSCSHGAGRRLSRKQARETLNFEEEIAALNKKNILHGMRHKSDLDEASSAYKNIDEVMNNQTDLVEIVVELTPLAVIKG